MNSTLSDYSNRENYALEAAKCIEYLSARNQNVTSLCKELLEINLSVSAYIEESKERLATLPLALAHDAKSSHQKTMSNDSTSPKEFNTELKRPHIDTTSSNKILGHQKARTFIQWYKSMVDNNRQTLALYLSDDATLEWFGRTIKTRKKVSSFLKFDMQHTKHDFTTVENIDKFVPRENLLRKEDTVPTNLDASELKTRNRKRKQFPSCGSPEWAPGCAPNDETEGKKIRKETEAITELGAENQGVKRIHEDNTPEMYSQGDGLERKKQKCMPTTPPNQEIGQGDCIPSTSEINSNTMQNTLNSELPKLAVQCNGFIEFTRTKNNRNIDSMKWERKCKLQVSYSEDQVNVGEYIIWALRYTDESKCRRNLLPSFEKLPAKC